MAFGVFFNYDFFSIFAPVFQDFNIISNILKINNYYGRKNHIQPAGN